MEILVFQFLFTYYTMLYILKDTYVTEDTELFVYLHFNFGFRLKYQVEIIQRRELEIEEREVKIGSKSIQNLHIKIREHSSNHLVERCTLRKEGYLKLCGSRWPFYTWVWLFIPAPFRRQLKMSKMSYRIKLLDTSTVITSTLGNVGLFPVVVELLFCLQLWVLLVAVFQTSFFSPLTAPGCSLKPQEAVSPKR